MFRREKRHVSFDKVLKEIRKHGEKIKYFYRDKESYITKLYYVEYEERGYINFNPYIILTQYKEEFKGSNIIRWTPNHEEMFSNDWVIKYK